MKFDIVIGNPPYNNGIDIDFAFRAMDLSDRYVSLITPAKWKTSDDNQMIESNHSYGEFRKFIMPYMTKICFYPCCKEVFSNILQVDGISYYLVDKLKNSKVVEVTNKSSYLKYLNSVELRDNLLDNTLINVGSHLIDYIRDLPNYTPFKFSNYPTNKKYTVWVNNKVPGGGLCTLEKPNRQTLFIGLAWIENRDDKNLYRTDASTLAFSSDNVFECESFISWLKCKLVGFLVAMNIGKLSNVITDHNFKYVPEPISKNGYTPFDKIYTDEILYKMYNIPKEYVEIIELMVASR